jgi:hypothetical protein
VSSDATAEIASILAAIDAAVDSADAGAVRRVTNPVFHKDMVIRGAEMSLVAQGRDACVQSYVDAAAAPGARAPAGEAARIEVFDDMAVAKSGADSFMFVLEDGRWQIAWRALLQDGSQPAT